MLRIKIELVPFGQEEGTKLLHTINIGNMGENYKYDDNGESYFNYDAWLDEDPRGIKPRPESHFKTQHLRSEGALKLCYLVLKGLLK